LIGLALLDGAGDLRKALAAARGFGVGGALVVDGVGAASS
jgi:hypothetical protein